MTDMNDNLVLQSAKFAEVCADVARRKFDTSVCGAEFMAHGYALLSGVPYSQAAQIVQAMLKFYESGFAFADPSKMNS